VAPPYCYRCPFGLTYPSCGLACVKNMEHAILGENPDTVAEVIVEPIMSGIGVAVPPDEYLKEVEVICRRYGILLHVDEVINGFGRTGKMFAHQHLRCVARHHRHRQGHLQRLHADRRDCGEEQRIRQLLREASENRQVMQVNTYGGSSRRRRRRTAEYRDPGGRASGRPGGGDRAPTCRTACAPC